MKISGERANDLGTTNQVQASDRRSGNGTGAAHAPAAAPATDRFDVSADVRLVNDAVRAVHQSPEIRTDKVEQAKQKLAAGELGADPERLAERMIDSLLGY